MIDRVAEEYLTEDFVAYKTEKEDISPTSSFLFDKSKLFEIIRISDYHFRRLQKSDGTI